MWRRTVVCLFLACLIGETGQRLAAGAAPGALASPALGPEYLAVERFFSEIEKPPVAYTARRRLEASSSKLNESAWMEAVTEYSPDRGLRYWIVAQGGSERIRRRVLNTVLDAEKENSARDEWRNGSLSRNNYEFNFDGRTDEGMLKLQLNPRRRDSRLVNGSALLTAESGNLVRIEGRLSKSPSFWIKWVHISRSYSPIHGTMMPTSIGSTADVRIAGLSTFLMTYDYQSVDGHAVGISPRNLALR